MERVAHDSVELVVVIQDVDGLGVVHEVLQLLVIVMKITIASARSAHFLLLFACFWGLIIKY